MLNLIHRSYERIPVKALLIVLTLACGAQIAVSLYVPRDVVDLDDVESLVETSKQEMSSRLDAIERDIRILEQFPLANAQARWRDVELEIGFLRTDVNLMRSELDVMRSSLGAAENRRSWLDTR